MKKILTIILFLTVARPASASHITGGEITYDFSGYFGTSKSYICTLFLFRDNSCTGCAVMPVKVTLFIFNNDTRVIQFKRVVPLSYITPLSVISSPPCLANAPLIDYGEGHYDFRITLPPNQTGYTITYQTCCRIDGIANINASNTTGATYTCTIPGDNALAATGDNSARFRDGISILCSNKHFILDFSATDPDMNDSLAYSFTYAYDGGLANSATFDDPALPPYGAVVYSPGFTGNTPLGLHAAIDPTTGIISGLAPEAGKYVVCVLVKSYLNGVLIAEHRKDFIVTIAPCDFPAANLPDAYRSCDSYTQTFVNLDNSPLNQTYFWDFGNPASGTLNTSDQEFPPPHTYTDTGVFTITLIINQGQPCADSAHANVYVYPVFTPAIKYIPPMCKDLPVQFTDSSRNNNFGLINYWHWDFGDPRGGADSSLLQNPVYTYHNPGMYDIELIVGTSRGCLDTLKPHPQVTIVDKPDFRIIPKDTLICTVDTLQMLTNAVSGTITWSPNTAISDVHSFNPAVSPDLSTTYHVLYIDPFGCSITDSSRIRVVSFVDLDTQNDTTICRSDSAMLLINSNALYYTWTPANVITDPAIQNPVIQPTDNLTDFHVHAFISAKCFADGDINVKTVPYPRADITGDTAICYSNDAHLFAGGGSIYTWSPIAYLDNPNSSHLVAHFPKANITYTVTVRDTLGCPKPVSNTFTLKVIHLAADAGSTDTSVVLGQPLQLHVADNGATVYSWTPVTYLDDPNIFNPISLPQADITYNVRVSNNIGCFATDTLHVRVFDLEAGLYVPSAFTPGKDGLNDLFRPIALGIKSLTSFRVFDRWGKLLFETNRINDGWNGTFKGKPLDSATFVWEATAVDYKGGTIFKKGTVILIR